MAQIVNELEIKISVFIYYVVILFVPRHYNNNTGIILGV
jgi:hypothetical protein